MLAFKWDHAVRDFLDPEKRFPTLCCLPQNRSLLVPPIDECSDPSKYQEVCAPACALIVHIRAPLLY